MESVAVVFTPSNARIFRNPDNMEVLSKMPNCAINPDLSLVSNLPPHFWKLADGKVLPMTEDEMRYRLSTIDKHGVDNQVKAIKKIKYKAYITLERFFIVSLVLNTALLSFLVYKACK